MKAYPLEFWFISLGIRDSLKMEGFSRRQKCGTLSKTRTSAGKGESDLLPAEEGRIIYGANEGDDKRKIPEASERQ